MPDSCSNAQRGPAIVAAAGCAGHRATYAGGGQSPFRAGPPEGDVQRNLSCLLILFSSWID